MSDSDETGNRIVKKMVENFSNEILETKLKIQNAIEGIPAVYSSSALLQQLMETYFLLADDGVLGIEAIFEQDLNNLRASFKTYLRLKHGVNETH